MEMGRVNPTPYTVWFLSVLFLSPIIGVFLSFLVITHIFACCQSLPFTCPHLCATYLIYLVIIC